MNYVLLNVQVAEEEPVTASVLDLLAVVRRRVYRVVVDGYVVSRVGIYRIVVGNLIVCVSNRVVQHGTGLISEGGKCGLIEVRCVLDGEASEFMDDRVEYDNAVCWNTAYHRVVGNYELIIVN
jgi:hypothetical protein